MTPPTKFKPFVPEGMQMTEFTWRAVILGLVMCVVLGAANAYLGLKAGQTIAATYPAAVIGMAVLRVVQRLHPRREYRAYRRLDRRIRGRGRQSSPFPAFVMVEGLGDLRLSPRPTGNPPRSCWSAACSAYSSYR